MDSFEETIYRRVSYPLYMRYRINKFELRFLIAFDGYCGRFGKTLVSARAFIDFMTRNIKEKRKLTGFMHGCLTGGFLGAYEYICQPGSLSLGISDLGFKVLREYQEEKNKMLARYPIEPKSTPFLHLYVQKKLAA